MASICPSCGAPAAGNFCHSCGAALAPQSCRACQATLSPQARFCHRCGTPAGAGSGGRGPAGGSSELRPWLVAGAAVLLLLVVIVYQVVAKRPAPGVPDMANVGTPGASRAAPDISQMSPRERFDRLFDRIMSAYENQDTASVVRFAPMAFGAYQMLDSVDSDARYHAALIRLAIGDTPQALALADTILRHQPGHLFGYMIRGEAAAAGHRPNELRRAHQDFLAHYAAEMNANREEYQQHRQVIEEFRAEAGRP